MEGEVSTASIHSHTQEWTQNLFLIPMSTPPPLVGRLMLIKDKTHSVPLMCMEKSPDKTVLNSASQDNVYRARRLYSPCHLPHVHILAAPSHLGDSIFSIFRAAVYVRLAVCSVSRTGFPVHLGEWMKNLSAWHKQPLTHWESGCDCLPGSFLLARS